MMDPVATLAHQLPGMLPEHVHGEDEQSYSWPPAAPLGSWGRGMWG